MAEKLTASILAAVPTFGMMAPADGNDHRGSSKRARLKRCSETCKEEQSKERKDTEKKLKNCSSMWRKITAMQGRSALKQQRLGENIYGRDDQNKKGSYYHFAAPYAFLAKESGVEARICLGRTNGFNKARWQDHAWCEVKVGKKWYICDPNMDKFAANSKGKYFMKTVSSMKSTFKKSKTIKVNFKEKEEQMKKIKTLIAAAVLGLGVTVSSISPAAVSMQTAEAATVKQGLVKVKNKYYYYNAKGKK